MNIGEEEASHANAARHLRAASSCADTHSFLYPAQINTDPVPVGVPGDVAFEPASRQTSVAPK
ncbi:hypothetical protein J2T09_003642 [Neorhizobium huautlense]|uniref:Uncharacterized protein n=1 Tax=Neorhizobium huautlense TaxID=67774 RepID=A0ABT9PWM3_9HYPH|nr:hypothetical protein [Neorhizobium huautlense]